MSVKSVRHTFKSKLRKGDEVVIIAGRSKGERGPIDQIDKKRNRVYVAGKNLGKRHQKADVNNHEGGIIEAPMPVHISNVALVDPKSDKATRIGFKVETGSSQNGGRSKKVRFAKSSGQELTRTQA